MPGQASYFRPFSNRFALSIASDESVSGRVSRLFRASCPFAILWAIVSFGINPFDRVRRIWFWSHILQKRLERVFPSFANLNSTAAVLVVLGTALIAATLLDSSPRRVFAADCSALHASQVSRGQGFFNGHPGIQSLDQTLNWNPQSISKDGACCSLALKRDQAIPTSVVVLILARNPSNVSREVSGVIVDTIQAESWTWHFPNIVEECTERLRPVWIHGDSSATIVGKVLAILVETASFDRGPNAVLRRSPSSFTHPMNSRTVGSNFGLQASARSGISTCQRTSAGDYCVSIDAHTIPDPLFVLVTSEGYDPESTKLPTDHV